MELLLLTRLAAMIRVGPVDAKDLLALRVQRAVVNQVVGRPSWQERGV
jgi:hypothetical protein